MSEETDHDILIEIRALQHERNQQFITHCETEATKHGLLEKAVAAAHRRIDALMVSGVLALLFFGFTLWFKSDKNEGGRHEDNRSNVTWDSSPRGDGLRR